MNLKRVDVPIGLKKAIFQRIALESKKIIRLKALVFGSSTVISSGVLMYVISYAAARFSESGFYQYFSLIFSGDGAVFVFWKELLLSLLESIPLLAVLGFFAILSFLLWVGAQAITNNLILWKQKIYTHQKQLEG